MAIHPENFQEIHSGSLNFNIKIQTAKSEEYNPRPFNLQRLIGF
jgi:hypothetical protein